MDTEEVTIDLELEDWGRMALIAHQHDLTINATINMLLRKFMDEQTDL